MRSLLALKHNLNQLIQANWSDTEVNSEFFALVDLSLGDFGSSAAIQLARKLSLAPQEILKVISESWPKEYDEQVLINRNYFNIRLPLCLADAKSSFAWPNISNQIQPPIIFVPKLYPGQTQGAYLRLISRALLQAELLACLGCATKIIRVEDQLELQGQTLAQKFNFFVSNWCSYTEAPVAALVDQISENIFSLSQPACLWFLPATIPQAQFQVLFPNNDRKPNLTLCYNEMGWAQLLVDQRQLDSFGYLPASKIASLILLLSENIAGTDLDFYVATSNENANLQWNLLCSYERALSFGQYWISQGEISENFYLRSLLMRQIQFENFLIRAAFDGEVGQFLFALRDYLSRFNSLFNNPNFRIRQSLGLGKVEGANILAGVCSTISAMIRKCPVLEFEMPR